jgi:hypothetical protein
MWKTYAHGQQLGQEAAKSELFKLKADLYVIHNDFVPGNATALIADKGELTVNAPRLIAHLRPPEMTRAHQNEYHDDQ